MTKVPVAKYNYTKPSNASTDDVVQNVGVKDSFAKYDSTVGKYYISTFSEPTLTNWQFDGWTESSDPDSDTTCYKTGDKLYLDGTPETVNLYTSWGQGAITVSLYDDLGLYEYTDRDGNKLTDNIKINWRTNKKFTNLPTPSVDGFMFNGWYTAKTGGT